jgi:hypothetical protein
VKVNKPIILFGTGRSGTTIFMDALFRHKDLAYFSNLVERKPNWSFLNNLRSIHDNKLFRVHKQRNTTALSQILNPFINKPVEGYKIWDHILPEKVSFLKDYLHDIKLNKNEKRKVYAYLENIVSKQNRSRMALKITGPGRLHFLSDLFPNAKFIWLKRSFMPTLNSFLNVDFWKDAEHEKLWWSSDKIQESFERVPEIKDDIVLLTAFQLYHIISDIEESIKTLKLNVLQVEYESFTENPENVMNEAFKFCELIYDKDCISFFNNANLENRNKSNGDYFDSRTLNRINSLREKLNYHTI